MLREEYLRRLVDSAYIEIYLSGMDGARIYWPWRMMPVHETSQRYRNSCEKYIVDSSFNKPDITNQDALDAAFRINAEFAVLADVYHDMNATVDALVDGHELAQDHGFDGNLIYPLQASHIQCYAELTDHGIEPEYIAIGGLKDARTQDQIGAARGLREFAGSDIWIHGLGWGLRKNGNQPNELVSAIHDSPDLIDSIDYSTPAHETTVPRHSIDSGEEYCSLQAAEIGTWLIRDLRRVSPHANIDSGSATQASLTKKTW
jgi:hypothetical protein